jgi:hypothetical protein
MNLGFAMSCGGTKECGHPACGPWRDHEGRGGTGYGQFMDECGRDARAPWETAS